jgi:hypothetical protein
VYTYLRLGQLGEILDFGVIRLLMLCGMGYFAWNLTEWSEAFASTAMYQLAQGKPVEWMGIAATIGAVAAAPVGLLTLLLSKYMEMRATQPVMIKDRRKEDNGSTQ